MMEVKPTGQLGSMVKVETAMTLKKFKFTMSRKWKEIDLRLLL